MAYYNLRSSKRKLRSSTQSQKSVPATSSATRKPRKSTQRSSAMRRRRSPTWLQQVKLDELDPDPIKALCSILGSFHQPPHVTVTGTWDRSHLLTEATQLARLQQSVIGTDDNFVSELHDLLASRAQQLVSAHDKRLALKIMVAVDDDYTEVSGEVNLAHNLNW